MQTSESKACLFDTDVTNTLAIENENYDTYLDKYGFFKLHEDAIVDEIMMIFERRYRILSV